MDVEKPMSEEPPAPFGPPPAADADENKPKVQPAMYPLGYYIPDELIESWVAIPETEPLVIGPLTRGDLDQLLFSTRDIAKAIGHLRDAVILLSRGKVDDADVMIKNSTNLAIDGEARNRELFKSIISSVLKVRNAAR